MTKHEIRMQMLAQRRGMQLSVAVGGLIGSRVFALHEVQAAAALMTYVSSKDNEVGTHEIIEWALRDGKTVLVPVCMPKRAMAWSVLNRLEDLSPSEFGILEPRQDLREIVLAPAEAPVLVPGIAFDRRGWRIGYGAGYFDRFLAHHRGLKIGLAYDCQLIDTVPHEPHDVPMDVIVTESQSLNCRYD